MGSNIAPKSFLPATSFGASPPSPIATETQPLALNSGTQTPAMSGYQMQMNQPITSPMSTPDGSGVNPQDLRNQLKMNRPITSGGTRLPFYG